LLGNLLSSRALDSAREVLGDVGGLVAGSRPRAGGTWGAAGVPRKPGEDFGLAQPKRPLKTMG